MDGSWHSPSFLDHELQQGAIIVIWRAKSSADVRHRPLTCGLGLRSKLLLGVLHAHKVVGTEPPASVFGIKKVFSGDV